jgi:hypothetical protein
LDARRTSALLLAIVALVVTALAGCGGDDDGGEDVDVGPAAAAPSDAPIYVDAAVRPEGAAKMNAEASLGKILDTDDPGGRLMALFDQAAGEEPPARRVTYEADIEPWLGDRVGAFFTSFEEEGKGALVIETTDPQAALDVARRSEGVSGTTGETEYNGATYQPTGEGDDAFGIVGDFLVFGDEVGIKAAIDASAGDSLGDSGEFTDALADLPDDRLGTLYTVPRNLLAAIPTDELDVGDRSTFENVAGENLDAPVSGALTATPESFDLEFISEGDELETPESALIGEVPADAWLAFGIGDLGSTVRQLLDQLRNADIPGLDQGISQLEGTTGSSLDELTDALGDSVIYVQGVTEPTLTGGLVVQVKDPELTGRLLSQLQGLLTLGGAAGVQALSLPGGGSGFQVNDPSNFPQPVELAQQGDKFVIGYGEGSAQQALQPADPLSGSPTFGAAKDQVAALGADLFLSFPQIFQLAEAEGAKKDPGYLEAKPYIDALEYLISGSGTDDGKAEAKAVLGLK